MNLGGWVPQFFYDLIARVAPGATLIAVTSVIFDVVSVDPASNQVLVVGADVPTASLFVVGLPASYVLGMLLSGLGYIVPGQLWRRTQTLRSRRNLENENLEFLRTQISYRYDYVHIHCPPVGARLAKLSAERGFCRVLLSGFLILAVVYPMLKPDNHGAGIFAVVEVALAVAGVAAYFLHKHLLLRSEESIRNNWKLLCERGEELDEEQE